MILELLAAGNEVIEISQSMLGLLLLMALFCGGFCTDACYHLIKYLFLKYKYSKYEHIRDYDVLIKEYRRLKNIENKYTDEIVERLKKGDKVV